MFRVNRPDIDVHTYKSMQNPKSGDGRDCFPCGLGGISLYFAPISYGLLDSVAPMGVSEAPSP